MKEGKVWGQKCRFIRFWVKLEENVKFQPQCVNWDLKQLSLMFISDFVKRITNKGILVIL